MSDATASPAEITPIHIIELKAENVKKLKAVEIHPKANGATLITGANGQGKTSVLDSLFFALAGKDAQKATPKPIREGESKAEVSIITSDGYKLRRWWNVTNSYLEITAPDGMPVKAPQEMLDSWVGVLSFDPLAFSRMNGKDQRAALLQIVELSIDLDANETKEGEHRERRKIIGRDLESLKAQIDAIPFAEIASVPDAEISVTELAKKLQDAGAHNRSVDDSAGKLQTMKTELETRDRAIKETEEKLVQMKRERETTAAAVNNAELMMKTMEKIDTAEIEKQMGTADETNKKVRRKAERVRLQEALKAKQAEYAVQEKAIDTLTTERSDALKNAKMPVEGLAIEPAGILYNGQPFSQISSAEQLKVAIAMAMANKPHLRVLRILDGSLLDDANLQVVEDMAKEHGFQVWIEKVDTSGKVGIVIEDGLISADNTQAVAAA
jgi:energy-coupling factor transporter ATP-binding protein EcfA2